MYAPHQYLNNISNSISDLERLLNDKHMEMTNILNNILNSYRPTTVRKGLNVIWQSMDNATNQQNEISELIEDNIRKLNEVKNIVNANIDKINEVKQKINKSSVGTLEGLARDVIKENDIVPEDEIVKTIIEQPYNEASAINRGGSKRRRSRRRKTTKKD
jgi:hypothetical protein